MKLIFGLLLGSIIFMATGSAIAGCNFDSECPTGYYCSSSTNKCVMGKWPDGGCNFDSDCQTGYFCGNGECKMGRWPDGGCTFDSDCLTGYYCNNDECRMGKWPDGGCSFDSDCLDGYECESNECEPVNKAMKATFRKEFLNALKVWRSDCN